MRSALALAVVLLLVAPAVAQDPPGAALFKTIKDKVGAGKPFGLVVTLVVKDDAAAKKLEAGAAKAVPLTVKEKGCQRYEFHRSAEDPNTYFLLEKWADLAALEAHFAADHTKELLGQLGDLLASPPKIVVTQAVGELAK